MMRDELLAQHRNIRELLEQAERLAADAGARAFGDALLALRRALYEHNLAEEAALVPMLRDRDAYSPQRIGRMFEEHAAEHVALRALLEHPDAEVAAALPDLADELRAHLDAEERTFLHPKVLT